MSTKHVDGDIIPRHNNILGKIILLNGLLPRNKHSLRNNVKWIVLVRNQYIK